MSCLVCQGYDSSRCPCCAQDVNMVLCPDCNGTGYGPFMALNIRTRAEVRVTAISWDLLPADEDIAFLKGENYCKLPRGCCPTCKGEGEIHENY